MSAKEKIPINPYIRKPIKSLNLIAGRSVELAELEYFFRLTSSGQSPHVALMGPRGIGKSSLLMSSVELARKLNLLTVNMDMNDSKAASQGTFWQYFYSSICLSLAKAGGFGGIHGDIYSSLSTMINCQEAVNGSYLLQFPKSLAKYKDNLDQMICSDSLILHDLGQIQEELQRLKIAGCVLYIDEADCLRHDPAMLQMIRNIFQRVDGFSLVMAGSKQLFSSVSATFSAIPAQFHKIEIVPFRHWSDTQQLLSSPLPINFHYLLPSQNQIIELHTLCNGDPSELQLYAFHMYKSVENGRRTEMALDLQIFRAVLQEYRSSAPQDTEEVVKQIESLPRSFFLNCPWLQLYNLSAPESVELTLFRAELDQQEPRSPEENTALSQQVYNSYIELFEKGLSTEENAFRLPGGPSMRGFWKSYVEVELGERWIWQNTNLDSFFIRDVFSRINEKTGSSGSAPIFELDHTETMLRAIKTKTIDTLQPIETADANNDKEQAIERLLKITQLFEFMLIVNKARFSNKTKILRIPITIRRNRQSLTQVLSFINYTNKIDKKQELLLAIENKRATYNLYDIMLDVGEPIEWDVPTEGDLKALEAAIKVEFRIDIRVKIEEAVQLVKDRKVEQAAKIFEEILKKSTTPQLLNNLAFCLLNLGKVPKAKELLMKAIELDPQPLFFQNLGISYLLEGNISDATINITQALNKTIEKSKWEEKALFVLIPNSDKISFYVAENLPISLGILLSLYHLGTMSEEDLHTRIKEVFGSTDTQQHWQDYLNNHNRITLVN